MSHFDSYFLMKPKDAIEYALEKLDIFDKDASLESKEIGDGNLNYVFRVRDKVTAKSVIIKQAGEVARISADMKLSTDRSRIEAEILKIQGDLAPGLVPEVYKYDNVMCCMSMEDMMGHTIMRTALMNHEKFPQFAEDISTFMVNTLLLTTDIVMEHKAKKALVESFINPELCEITEDLVYTEPFNDNNARNNVFAPNAEFVQKELYEDRALHLEAAKLKFAFMNNAQSLIHGDLHTGSIFVKQDSTFIFDPEFAFYGPMGYDIGNVIANLLFAWANADATILEEENRNDYTAWLQNTIKSVVDLFIVKFKVTFQEKATDVLAKTEGFCNWYLGTVLSDTAAVTGLEMIRRTVGMANVKDITSIADSDKRARAERILIILAKDCIMHRADFVDGQSYLNSLKKAVEKF